MENNKLGKEPAYPTSAQLEGGSIYQEGMSKRFYAACSAMQGLLCNPNIIRPGLTLGNLEEQYNQFSKICFEYADELLKQENL